LNTVVADEEAPFYEASGAECRSTSREVTAKITFKLCNENENHEIALNGDQTFITYLDLKLDFSKENIQPNTCRKIEIMRSWDLCDVSSNKGRRKRPFDVQLDGRVDVDGDDNHCYCKSKCCFQVGLFDYSYHNTLLS
jgi:hypothetical protein